MAEAEKAGAKAGSVAELRATGDSRATLALGPAASSAAAKALDIKCHVPCEILELPIGLGATDRFIDSLRRLAGEIQRQRATLQVNARTCAEILWQAEADAEISPILYWTSFL